MYEDYTIPITLHKAKALYDAQPAHDSASARIGVVLEDHPEEVFSRCLTVPPGNWSHVLRYVTTPRYINLIPGVLE